VGGVLDDAFAHIKDISSGNAGVYGKKEEWDICVEQAEDSGRKASHIVYSIYPFCWLF
jgi:hypothetical protein